MGAMGIRRRAPFWRAHPVGRYVVDREGRPVLIWGEGAWTLNSQLAPLASHSATPNTPAASTLAVGQRVYLADRQARGLNCFGLQLISRYQGSSPNDSDGVAPFTTANDFATFNQAYFDKAARAVQLAGEYGMVVFIFPAWEGYSDGLQGWHDALVSNGTIKCKDYGVAVAKTFYRFDNIVWGFGGDRNTSFATAEVQALADGVLSVDTRHMNTAHWNFASSDSQTGPWNTTRPIKTTYAWNSGQGGPVYTQVRTEYDQNTGPVFTIESLYDGNTSFGWTRQLGRTQSIMTMLMGGCGSWYGHEGVWHLGAPNTNLPSQSQNQPYNLEAASMTDQVAIRGAFVNRRWYDLVPDAEGTAFVTAGRGTYSNNDYVGVAKTADSTLAFLYWARSSGSFTVARSGMSGTFTFKRIDPTTGTETAVSGSPFTNTGTVTFTPSTDWGNNAGGNPDWLLVLEV